MKVTRRTSIKFGMLGMAISLVAATTALVAPAEAASYKLTIALGHPSVDLGHAVHITGNVSPRAAGKTAWLQQSTSKGWRDLRSGRVNHNCHYDIAVKPVAAGAYGYRVAVGSAASPKVILRVYRWHYLSDLTEADGGDMYPTPVTINGTLYVHSVETDLNSYASSFQVSQWNLSRKCSEFQTAVGLTDDSFSDTQADVQISVDGQSPLFEQVFPFGTSAGPDLNVRGALRLQVGVLQVAGSTDDSNYVGLGNAKVRCTW